MWGMITLHSTDIIVQLEPTYDVFLFLFKSVVVYIPSVYKTYHEIPRFVDTVHLTGSIQFNSKLFLIYFIV